MLLHPTLLKMLTETSWVIFVVVLIFLLSANFLKQIWTEGPTLKLIENYSIPIVQIKTIVTKVKLYLN